MVDSASRRFQSVGGERLARNMPPRVSVVAKSIEELQIYQRALAADNAVTAMLERPAFNKDPELKSQLNRSASRVAPLIAEGFGQLTDKHFAVYVARARGSALESCTHLAKAHRRGFITAAELGQAVGLFQQVGKMATSLIHYLQKADRKHRG